MKAKGLRAVLDVRVMTLLSIPAISLMRPGSLCLILITFGYNEGQTVRPFSSDHSY